MELSDYDILGVDKNSSFRIIKNAYYDLCKIYHPDSLTYKNILSVKDKIECFKKIKTAYENIKKIMNVVEVDLPMSNIEYNMNDFKINHNIEYDDDNFNEKFNKKFEEINKIENKDNPFSIYYELPEVNKRNLQDSHIVVKEKQCNNSNSIYEFGINYIDDHSTNSFYDINKLTDENKLNNNDTIKEIVDEELESKLENLINIRNKKIDINEYDLEFINNQNNIKIEIQKSKDLVENNRRLNLLN